ncbi:hypothetical protein JTB14_007500 [Gonioctena quinquepunctata]|nr:hypothetical protein JTB14_007500 [Gonioctena quinquepunctata]
MLLKSVILVILLKVSLGKHNRTALTGLLNEFVIMQNIPSKVTAYICWNKDDQVLLWKQLSENGFPTRIGREHFLNYTFPREHQLFLMDLNCEDSSEILEEVCSGKSKK